MNLVPDIKCHLCGHPMEWSLHDDTPGAQTRARCLRGVYFSGLPPHPKPCGGTAVVERQADGNVLRLHEEYIDESQTGARIKVFALPKNGLRFVVSAGQVTGWPAEGVDLTADALDDLRMLLANWLEENKEEK